MHTDCEFLEDRNGICLSLLGWVFCRTGAQDVEESRVNEDVLMPWKEHCTGSQQSWLLLWALGQPCSCSAPQGREAACDTVQFQGSRTPLTPSVLLTQTGLRVPPMNGDVPEVFLAGGDLVPQGHTARCLSVVESREQLEEDEEEEEEGKTEKGDGFHAVPLRRSGAFRAHGHNHNPFKRHSWGPGRELQDPLSR